MLSVLLISNIHMAHQPALGEKLFIAKQTSYFFLSERQFYRALDFQQLNESDPVFRQKLEQCVLECHLKLLEHSFHSAFLSFDKVIDTNSHLLNH